MGNGDSGGGLLGLLILGLIGAAVFGGGSRSGSTGSCEPNRFPSSGGNEKLPNGMSRLKLVGSRPHGMGDDGGDDS